MSCVNKGEDNDHFYPQINNMFNDVLQAEVNNLVLSVKYPLSWLSEYHQQLIVISYQCENCTINKIRYLLILDFFSDLFYFFYLWHS
jgi:hypothetical protein